MPIIINEMEIVPDPPDEGGDADAESEASATTPLSPAVIREILNREDQRSARVFAH